MAVEPTLRTASYPYTPIPLKDIPVCTVPDPVIHIHTVPAQDIPVRTVPEQAIPELRPAHEKFNISLYETILKRILKTIQRDAVLGRRTRNIHK